MDYKPLRLLLVALCALINLRSAAELLPPLSADVESALESAPLARTNLTTVLEAWQVFADRAPIWANKWSNDAKTQLQQLLNKTTISQECTDSLYATLGAGGQLEEWAVKSEYLLINRNVHLLRCFAVRN